MTVKKQVALPVLITAIMTGISYKTSAEMAKMLGAFPSYTENKEDMLRVMRNHRAAAYDADAYEGLRLNHWALMQNIALIIY